MMSFWYRSTAAAAGLLLATAASAAASNHHRPAKTATIGVASWYGGVHAGRATASGEAHSPALRTAAHRNLPFGTLVRVTNLDNGRSAVVRVNDRGPFVAGRVIDLSESAARDLAMLDSGLASVRLEVLSRQ
jgi:rare lipoprotein A